MPSEWLPRIFGGEMPEFKSQTQLQGFMDTVFRKSNRFASAFHSNKLVFPYDLSDQEYLIRFDREYGADQTFLQAAA